MVVKVPVLVDIEKLELVSINLLFFMRVYGALY
jgi:hypothetical protein